MPYEYLDGITTADVAFRAWGNSREEMFCSAAAAVLNVMLDNPEELSSKIKRRIVKDNPFLDMLLFQFLDELIYLKDADRLLLKTENIWIESTASKFVLNAQLSGECIDPQRHKLKVDVKAVTLHHFKVEKKADIFSATVVLDI